METFNSSKEIIYKQKINKEHSDLIIDKKI